MERKELKSQEVCRCSYQSFKVEIFSLGVKVYLYIFYLGQLDLIMLNLLFVYDLGFQLYVRIGDYKSLCEYKSLLEVQRFRKELSNCIYKIEEIIKKGEENWIFYFEEML